MIEFYLYLYGSFLIFRIYVKSKYIVALFISILHNFYKTFYILYVLLIKIKKIKMFSIVSEYQWIDKYANNDFHNISCVDINIILNVFGVISFEFNESSII